MITLIGPSEGGVAHVSRRLAASWPADDPVAVLLVSDDGVVVSSSCRCPDPAGVARTGGAVALTAVRSAWAHRRCLRRSDSVHVELGRTSVGAFWFALAAGVLTRGTPVVVATHDVPVVVRHPAAALVRRRRGLWDRLAYRVVAPVLDGPVLGALRRRACATVVLSRAAERSALDQGWPQVLRTSHGAAPRTRPGVSAAAGHHVLLAGYLGPGKGLDVLAKAWSQVASPLPLVVAGGHSEHDAAWVAAVRTELDSGANPPTWLGYVDDDAFERLVRESAVVVIPYVQSNPASGVLVRALVEGRAVVGTRVPAVVEEVVDGCNGLLVEPGDAAALAAALRRLVAGPGLRDRLGEEAARRAGASHAWSTHAGALARLHRGLRSVDETTQVAAGA